jgi:hypothetical protein
MARAKETAHIIASQVPSGLKLLQSPDATLNEALPAPIIPVRPDVPNAEHEIDDNHQRIEQAFQKYFWRAMTAEDSDNQAVTIRTPMQPIMMMLSTTLDNDTTLT